MKKGFTLIEVLVAISIFAMVMLVATGAVFSIVEANRKTHSLKSVMTNLNFALESMTRDIRVGSRYGCDTEISVPGDCVTGGSVFHYTPNTAAAPGDQIKYTLANSRIQKTNYGGSQAPVYTTAAEIVIETLRFYVLCHRNGGARRQAAEGGHCDKGARGLGQGPLRIQYRDHGFSESNRFVII
jgi:prepilin-type N-terminal cleavage/methylation domain-containing protein